MTKKVAKKKTTKKKVVRKKTTKAEPKNKVGRPTKFDASQIEYIKYMLETGLNDREVSEKLGIHERTFYRWKQANPEFCQSLKDWKLHADKVVEDSLYKRAHGFECMEEKVFCDAKTGRITTKMVKKVYPPDPTSMIFWLKNRNQRDWRDKQIIEHGNEENKSFSFNLIKSPDQVQEEHDNREKDDE